MVYAVHWQMQSFSNDSCNAVNAGWRGLTTEPGVGPVEIVAVLSRCGDLGWLRLVGLGGRVIPFARGSVVESLDLFVRAGFTRGTAGDPLMRVRTRWNGSERVVPPEAAAECWNQAERAGPTAIGRLRVLLL